MTFSSALLAAALAVTSASMSQVHADLVAAGESTTFQRIPSSPVPDLAFDASSSSATAFVDLKAFTSKIEATIVVSNMTMLSGIQLPLVVGLFRDTCSYGGGQPFSPYHMLPLLPDASAAVLSDLIPVPFDGNVSSFIVMDSSGNRLMCSDIRALDLPLKIPDGLIYSDWEMRTNKFLAGIVFSYSTVSIFSNIGRYTSTGARMYLTVSFAAFCGAFGSVWIFLQLEFAAPFCKGLVTLVTGSYIAGKAATYVFLTQKALVVGSLTKIQTIGLVFCWALNIGGWIATIATISSTVDPISQVCITEDINSVVLALFAIGDSLMSFSLLYMFAKPLLDTANNMRQADSRVHDVAKRNMLNTVVAVLSTSLVSFILFIGHGRIGVWSSGIFLVDVTINIAMMNRTRSKPTTNTTTGTQKINASK